MLPLDDMISSDDPDDVIAKLVQRLIEIEMPNYP